MGSVARLSLVELRMHISRNRIDRFERIMTVNYVVRDITYMDFVQFHLLVFAPMFIDQFRTCFKIRDVTDSSDTFFFFSKITNNFYILHKSFSPPAYFVYIQGNLNFFVYPVQCVFPQCVCVCLSTMCISKEVTKEKRKKGRREEEEEGKKKLKKEKKNWLLYGSGAERGSLRIETLACYPRFRPDPRPGPSNANN